MLTQMVKRGSVLATAGVELMVEVCPHCHCVYAFPRDLYQRARDDSKVTVYFPNGHSWVYSTTLRERLAEAAKDANRAESRVIFWLEQHRASERSRASTRGHLTRLKKRVAKGVCPCCNRTFRDLARHMESKHPNYAGKKQGG